MSTTPNSTPNGKAGVNLLNNRYRLLATVAAGGMATVYKAQDQMLNRLVAVKILRERYARDPQFVQRFREEASAAANLNHPNVVTIFDVGRDVLSDQERHYIVMELVEGEDLKQLIRGRQISAAGFEVDEAVNLVRQVCEGVAYAHKRGLVHCDLKPQNVLLTHEHRAKVTDFGIARAFTNALAQAKEEVVWGTPQYYAPEQAAGAPPTPASDVYSLGIMLYELLAGKLPFEARDSTTLGRLHQTAEAPSLSEANPSVSMQLEGIVRRALSKDPAQRYRNADQMAAALSAYLQQGDENTLMGMSPVTGPTQPTRETQRPRPVTPGPATGAAAKPRPAEPAPSSIQDRIAQRGTRIDTQGTDATGATGAYTQNTQGDARAPARGGFDPLLLLLGAVAVLCVLGLIPLWANVYTEYTKQAPAAAPTQAPPPGQEPQPAQPNAPAIAANTPNAPPGATATAQVTPTASVTATLTPTPTFTLPTALVGSVLDDGFKSLALTNGISLVITDTYSLLPENTVLAIAPNSATLPLSSTLLITVSSGGRVRLEAQLPRVIIESARFQRDEFLPGMNIAFDVTWRASGRIGRDYKVLVHLIGPDGALVDQDGDRAPRNYGAEAPTSTWGNGTVVVDSYVLDIPLTAPPGAYEVRVGLYDDSGRVAFVSPGAGAVKQDSLIVRTVNVR
jgi:eukaryotic-like serine/threonine-protein kinase